MIRPVVNNKYCEGQWEIRKNNIMTKKIISAKSSINSSCPTIFENNRKKRNILQIARREPNDCIILYIII